MKAKVIETGEIIEVVSLYSPIYSRLDCNGKIVSEYDEDELEFISNSDKPKMVSLDKICEWIKNNAHKYIYFDEGNTEWYDNDECIEDLRKEFE
jgi:hypothetical protein